MNKLMESVSAEKMMRKNKGVVYEEVAGKQEILVGKERGIE